MLKRTKKTIATGIRKFSKATLLVALTVLYSSIIFANPPLDETKTVGSSGADYVTLKAAFDAINNGTLTGNIILKVIDHTNETATAVLNASGGTSSYTTVKVYPTQSGLSITGNLAAPLIDLDGADNVIIDGRVNATGGTKNLIISNASTSTTAGTSTIRLINDASQNTIQYCTLKGSGQATLGEGGVVFVSTGTTTGNNSNTIDHCNITNAGGRPTHGICSNGTSIAIPNKNFSISNSNVYDFFNAAKDSYGIYASNSDICFVTGNSFYETTEFAATASVSQRVIYINTGGGGHTVSSNYIGGRTNACGGEAMTKTDVISDKFYGIWVDGNASLSNIQGNTIQNINWKSREYFYGIYLEDGLWNIGTTTGNTIGAGTGTGSITFTSANYSTFNGLYFGESTRGSLVQNNIIGSITISNISAGYISFFGVWHQFGFCTYSNNTIGSTTTPKSINTTSVSTAGGQVCGMLSNSGGATFNNNTVANMFNACTGTSASIYGLWGGTANNNIIHDLYGSGGTGTGYYASVIGLKGCTSTGNLIYNLYNSGENTNVIGIIPGYGGSKNNVIRIGSTTSNASFYGIWDEYNQRDTYNNTVYIGGNVATLNNANSAAFVSNINGYRNYRNNIFVNARSNTAGGTGKNYAVMVTDNTNLTLDYNDYYTSGTGGVLGSYNGVDVANLEAWKVALDKDEHSLNIDPQFALAGGNLPTDYMVSSSLPGVSGTGVTVDFAGTVRAAIPTMGAFENAASVPTIATSGSLSAFTKCAGAASTAQSFTASGSNLTANITVTAPTGFEVSKTSSTTAFASSVTLTLSGATVANTAIWVRLTSSAIGSPSGNVALTSTGAETKNLAVSGTVIADFVPPTKTLADLVVTKATGATLKYYNAASGGAELLSSEQIASTPTIYYISQVVNGVESTDRLAVTTYVDQTPCSPLGNGAQSVSLGTVGNLVVSGTNIRWYYAEGGGSLLEAGTNLVVGKTYYASQTVGCTESETRLAVTIIAAMP